MTADAASDRHGPGVRSTHTLGTVLAVLHDRYAIARLATRAVELRDVTLRELDPAKTKSSGRRRRA